jgi:Family of unknown function (DUF5694)
MTQTGEVPRGRIPVLLVGSFHMDNPGQDAAGVVVDDVLAPERQAQLEDVADRLAGFAPTKVLVEAPWNDAEIQTRYVRHRTAGAALRRSEVEQVGFRVAVRLGHDTIWPIDVSDVFFDPEVERVAAADPEHGWLYAGALSAAKRMVAEQQSWLTDSTIASTLCRMNEPGALHDALAVYIRFLTPIVAAPIYPGPDMVAAWYRRNLRILSHLYRISAPGDRLLVVFGQGHIAVFRQLLQFFEVFDTVDAVPWLAGTAGPAFGD